jgi:hypothetical protein
VAHGQYQERGDAWVRLVGGALPDRESEPEEERMSAWKHRVVMRPAQMHHHLAVFTVNGCVRKRDQTSGRRYFADRFGIRFRRVTRRAKSFRACTEQLIPAKGWISATAC